MKGMNPLCIGSITLEPQLAAHAKEMFVVLSDPAIYEFENAPPESLDWLTKRFEMLEARAAPDASEQWLNWVVRLGDGGLAGFVQATVTGGGVAHVAYVFASQHWGHGIGSASVQAMLAELTTAYGVRAFAATLKAANFRSMGLLRSLDFAEEVPFGTDPVACDDDEFVMYKCA